MKERPILFQPWKVARILKWDFEMDGNMQTRRVIKPQPQFFDKGHGENSSWFVEWCHPRTTCMVAEWGEGEPVPQEMLACCPYGAPGDRLWVRETWAHDCPHCVDVRCGNPDHIWYRASESERVAQSFAGTARWRPSIHMPRWASRLTLEVIRVRVERVRDISEADAKAEGVQPIPGHRYAPFGSKEFRQLNHRDYFRAKWDCINAKRGFGWDTNPWVWVVEFKRAG